MRKSIMTVLAALSLSLAACTSYSPDAGHEVVLVKKPWFMGHGGIESEPVKTGLVWTAGSTQGVDVDMRPMMYQQSLPDTMTSDGVPISFHAIITLQVTDSVGMVKNFGAGWYERNLEQPFAAMVRQAVRKHGMNETAISTTALDDIDAEIKTNLAAFISEKGIPVKLITMTVGRANPPDAIKHQRIETAAQEQRVNTEKQIKLAEDQRAFAEKSRAVADNTYRNELGISPEQYIQLKRIEMEQSVCEKGGCTFISNGVNPTLAIK